MGLGATPSNVFGAGPFIQRHDQEFLRYREKEIKVNGHHIPLYVPSREDEVSDKKFQRNETQSSWLINEYLPYSLCAPKNKCNAIVDQLHYVDRFHKDFTLRLCEHGLYECGQVSYIDLLFHKIDGILFGCGLVP